MVVVPVVVTVVTYSITGGDGDYSDYAGIIMSRTSGSAGW